LAPPNQLPVTCNLFPVTSSDSAVRTTDLHAHILPGLDDGARDVAEALAMLRAAVADGVGTLVATPHAHHVTPAWVRAGVARLQALAAAEELPIAILPGSEVRIVPELVERLRDDLLLALNGTRWLLLELYLNDEWPLRLVVQAVERYLAAGLKLVLAHPERYPFAQRDPLALLPLVERGVLLQLNAGSLFGKNGNGAQRAAETLLRRHAAHIIASDAHNAQWRPPVIGPALRRAAELTGAEYAAWLAGNPARILADEDIALPTPLDAHDAGASAESRPPDLQRGR
jgi:protein-tyrosine phosphatase